MAIDELLRSLTTKQARLACGTPQIEKILSFLGRIAGIVNPENRDFSLFYPMSGADVLTALYIANPKEVLMLDMLPFAPESPETPASVEDAEDFERIYVSDSNFLQEYFGRIVPRGSVFTGTLQGYLEPFVMAQLALSGVDIEKVLRNDGEVPWLSFEWKHPNERRARERKVQFRKGIFMGTEEIAQEFDIMLVKSGMGAAANFAARGQALRKGGLLLADDWMKLPSSRLYDAEPLPKSIIDEYKGLHGYVFGSGLPPHILVRK